MYSDNTSQLEHINNKTHSNEDNSQKMNVHPMFSEEELENMYLRFYYGEDYSSVIVRDNHESVNCSSSTENDQTLSSPKNSDHVLNQMSTNDTYTEAGGDKPLKFLCPYCSYSYNQEGYLSCHVKFIHDRIDFFKCDKCSFSAKKLNSLKIHEKITHSRKHLLKKCKISNIQNIAKVPSLNVEKAKVPKVFKAYLNKRDNQLIQNRSDERKIIPKIKKKIKNVLNVNMKRPEKLI